MTFLLNPREISAGRGLGREEGGFSCVSARHQEDAGREGSCK